MKKNVLILFGGESSEYEISLISAYNVLCAIDKDVYNIYTVGITKDGKWYYYNDDYESIKDGTWIEKDVKKAIISPCKSDSGIIIFDKEVKKIKIDVCYPVLHGKNGEDGTVQGLLTLAGIKFVGCSYMSSAVCMDKVMTKIVLEKNNIPQTPYEFVKKNDFDMIDINKRVDENIGYPCFVKPVNAGSSVGASKVENKEELFDAIYDAFKFDSKVLIEKFINAREIEVAVLGNEKITIAGPGEIVANSEFYDYDTKYVNGTTEYKIPAELDDETTAKITEYAKCAYKVLDCKGLSRIDFFLDKDTSEIYLNEINTLPGFTNISMYPKLFIEKGFKYKELVTTLIELASL